VVSESLSLALPSKLVEAIASRAAELVVEQLGNGSPWLTRSEAAAYLRLPVSRLEKDKAIPCHREGRRVLYHRDELDAYLSKKLDTLSPTCLDW
jgi:excisionase family DNA binding protein